MLTTPPMSKDLMRKSVRVSGEVIKGITRSPSRTKLFLKTEGGSGL